MSYRQSVDPVYDKRHMNIEVVKATNLFTDLMSAHSCATVRKIMFSITQHQITAREGEQLMCQLLQNHNLVCLVKDEWLRQQMIIVMYGLTSFKNQSTAAVYTAYHGLGEMLSKRLAVLTESNPQLLS